MDAPKSRTGIWRRDRWLWVALGALVMVAGVPVLVSSLEDDREIYRRLGDLDSPDRNVRRDAVMNLHRPHAWIIRGRGERAIIHALDDPDTEVRRAATSHMERMGEAARPAIPRLFELLADPDDRTRVFAAGSLIGLGPHLPIKPDAEIAQLLASPDPSVRRSGLAEVIRLGPECKRLFLQVAELTDDLDPIVRGLSFDILLTQDRRDPIDEGAARVMIEKYREIPRDDPRWLEFTDRVLDPKFRPLFGS